VAFIVLRLLHAIMYLADRPPLRTTFFSLALFSAFGLFVLAAFA
jgi:uncharacterized MAPEG superfamily protein